MENLIEALRKSKSIQHQTIDEDYCKDYTDAVNANSEISLVVTIETRASCILVGSPKFKRVEDAIKWYEQLDYVDHDMYAYVGFFDEYDEICHIAEFEDKK